MRVSLDKGKAILFVYRKDTVLILGFVTKNDVLHIKITQFQFHK